MPINLRDFLTFPFNNGKGIRTNQLDGEYVKKVESDGTVTYQDTSGDEQTVEVSTAEQRVLLDQASASADTYEKLAIRGNAVDLTERQASHARTEPTVSFEDYTDANYIGALEADPIVTNYVVEQWYYSIYAHRPRVVTDINPFEAGDQVAFIDATFAEVIDPDPVYLREHPSDAVASRHASAVGELYFNTTTNSLRRVSSFTAGVDIGFTYSFKRMATSEDLERLNSQIPDVDAAIAAHAAIESAHQDTPRRVAYLNLDSPIGRSVYLTQQHTHPGREHIFHVPISELASDVYGASRVDLSSISGLPPAAASFVNYPSVMAANRIAAFWQNGEERTIRLAVNSSIEAPTVLHVGGTREGIAGSDYETVVPLTQESLQTVGGVEYRIMMGNAWAFYFSNLAGNVDLAERNMQFSLQHGTNFMEADGTLDTGTVTATGNYLSLGDGTWIARERVPHRSQVHAIDSDYTVTQNQMADTIRVTESATAAVTITLPRIGTDVNVGFWFALVNDSGNAAYTVTLNSFVDLVTPTNNQSIEGEGEIAYEVNTDHNVYVQAVGANQWAVWHPGRTSGITIEEMQDNLGGTAGDGSDGFIRSGQDIDIDYDDDAGTLTIGSTASSRWEYVEFEALEALNFSDTEVAQANGAYSFYADAVSGTGWHATEAYANAHGRFYRWPVPSGGAQLVLADLGNINNNAARTAVNGSHFMIANTGTGIVTDINIGGIGSVFPDNAQIHPGGVVEVVLMASEDGTPFADTKLFNLIVTPHDEEEDLARDIILFNTNSIVASDFASGVVYRFGGSSNATLTLPSLSGSTYNGKTLYVANDAGSGTPTLTVSRAGNDTIRGRNTLGNTITIPPGGSIKLIAVSGSRWFVLDQSQEFLTDAQIGDKAFSNPPGDLDSTEKDAVLDAIDADQRIADKHFEFRIDERIGTSVLKPGHARRIGVAKFFGIAEWHPSGLAWDGTSLYLVGGQLDRIAIINQEDGSAIVLPNVLGSGVIDPRGLAWDGTNLFVADNATNALYTANIVTGVATRVGSATDFGVGLMSPGDMAWDGTNLYLTNVDSTGIGLYTVNRTTGVATRVGTATDFGVGEQVPRGLAWDGTDLYMNGGSADSLYIVDRTTGVATRVGDAVEFGSGITLPRGLAWDGIKLYMVAESVDGQRDVTALYEVGRKESVSGDASSADVANNTRAISSLIAKTQDLDNENEITWATASSTEGEVLMSDTDADTAAAIAALTGWGSSITRAEGATNHVYVRIGSDYDNSDFRLHGGDPAHTVEIDWQEFGADLGESGSYVYYKATAFFGTNTFGTYTLQHHGTSNHTIFRGDVPEPDRDEAPATKAYVDRNAVSSPASSRRQSLREISTASTLLASDIENAVRFVANLNALVRLPDVTGDVRIGSRLKFINSGTGTIELRGNNADTVNGALFVNIPSGQTVICQVVGTSAWIITGGTERNAAIGARGIVALASDNTHTASSPNGHDAATPRGVRAATGELVTSAEKTAGTGTTQKRFTVADIVQIQRLHSRIGVINKGATNTTLVASERGQVIRFQGVTTPQITCTMPAIGGTDIGIGWDVWIINDLDSTLDIAAGSSQTIEGEATLEVPRNHAVHIIADTTTTWDLLANTEVGAQQSPVDGAANLPAYYNIEVIPPAVPNKAALARNFTVVLSERGQLADNVNQVRMDIGGGTAKQFAFSHSSGPTVLTATFNASDIALVDNDAEYTYMRVEFHNAGGLLDRQYVRIPLDADIARAAGYYTDNDIRDSVEAADDSNTFSDNDHTKLDGLGNALPGITVYPAGLETFDDIENTEFIIHMDAQQDAVQDQVRINFGPVADLVNESFSDNYSKVWRITPNATQKNTIKTRWESDGYFPILVRLYNDGAWIANLVHHVFFGSRFAEPDIPTVYSPESTVYFATQDESTTSAPAFATPAYNDATSAWTGISAGWTLTRPTLPANHAMWITTVWRTANGNVLHITTREVVGYNVRYYRTQQLTSTNSFTYDPAVHSYLRIRGPDGSYGPAVRIGDVFVSATQARWITLASTSDTFHQAGNIDFPSYIDTEDYAELRYTVQLYRHVAATDTHTPVAELFSPAIPGIPTVEHIAAYDDHDPAAGTVYWQHLKLNRQGVSFLGLEDAGYLTTRETWDGDALDLHILFRRPSGDNAQSKHVQGISWKPRGGAVQRTVTLRLQGRGSYTGL